MNTPPPPSHPRRRSPALIVLAVVLGVVACGAAGVAVFASLFLLGAPRETARASAPIEAFVPIEPDAPPPDVFDDLERGARDE